MHPVIHAADISFSGSLTVELTAADDAGLDAVGGTLADFLAPDPPAEVCAVMQRIVGAKSFVALPVVVRTNEAQSGGICRCVGPRCWSYTMLLSGIAAVALTILDVILIYRQYADGEPFIWSNTMWASIGFILALCVCCGLCLATHGGTGVISLIVGDKALMDDERIRR